MNHAALEAEPDSNVARESLFDALGAKVALLRDTVPLLNDMRNADHDSDAREVSGLNP